jgi:hypothetical protein
MQKIVTVLAASTALTLTLAAPARAGDVEQMCSGWDESTIVADTPSWGRIGQRMCVQWNDVSGEIRQKIEARFDWPMGGCSVSIPAGASCPADRLWKAKRVTLEKFTMDFTFESPDTGEQSTSCDKGGGVFEPFTQLGGAVTTGCVTDWQPQTTGDYWVSGDITFRRGGTVVQLPTSGWFGVTVE